MRTVEVEDAVKSQRRRGGLRNADGPTTPASAVTSHGAAGTLENAFSAQRASPLRLRARAVESPLERLRLRQFDARGYRALRIEEALGHGVGFSTDDRRTVRGAPGDAVRLAGLASRRSSRHDRRRCRIATTFRRWAKWTPDGPLARSLPALGDGGASPAGKTLLFKWVGEGDRSAARDARLAILLDSGVRAVSRDDGVYRARACAPYITRTSG
jgi:hypothetical protein